MSIATDTATTFDNRVAFAETLVEAARADERVVAVCNDSVGSSNLASFRDEFPDRLINVGIAEQNMVGVGAGLAASGLIPFVCAAGPFLTGRALEQIKADVAYSQHPVVLCGMSPGMAYGELGPTHHSIEDFSWLRALPGLDIAVPADRRQTAAAVRELVAHPRPTYLRVGRHKVPDVTSGGDEWTRGAFTVAAEGTDVTVLAVGTMVSRAVQASRHLEGRGISARVLNAAWLSPLDEDAILTAVRETRGLVVAEEATVSGGLGAAVASLISQQGSTLRKPVRLLGVRGFAPTGDNDYLLEHFGLTSAGIVAAAEDVLENG